MLRTKLKTIALLLTPMLLLVAFAFAPASANSHPNRAGWSSHDRDCTPVGGTIITNFGALGQDAPNTTLGPVTGDLAGAVAGSLIGQPVISGNIATFTVQHHWVVNSGDNIYFDQAQAKTAVLSQTRFAIIDYPVHIKGGTGKFAGAVGDLNAVGEVDLIAGTAFRYFGKVCFADQN